MGDRLGTPGVVDYFYFAINFIGVGLYKIENKSLSMYNHEIEVDNI